MNKISEVFGTNVFSDAVRRERLPKEIYKQLQRTIKEGKHLIKFNLSELKEKNIPYLESVK